jgi:copper chaperone
MRFALNRCACRGDIDSKPVVESPFECGIEGETGKTEQALHSTMATELTVDDMACTGCETTVEEALRDVTGVTDVEADHESGTVTVEGNTDADDLVGAVDDAGYTASA